ncbi:MAG: tetratricopeptide repeat protein [PVC group bacterium]
MSDDQGRISTVGYCIIKTTFKQKIALIVFGLFLGIVLLEIGLRIGGFIFLYLQERANLASLTQRGEFVIMCLGESTTALGGDNAYPRQLEKILNERNTGIKFSVINKGIVATDTTIIASLLEENLDHYKPDIVLTMIGINDRQNKLIFEDTLSAKFSRFLKNFRVYKLARLLQKHISLTLQNFFSEPSEAKESELSEDKPVCESPDVSGETEKRLRGLIRGHPEDPMPYLELGDLLMTSNRLEEAEALFLKVEAIAPELIENRYDDLTCIHFDQGNFQQCMRIGEKAITYKEGKISSIVGDRLARAYLDHNPGEAERICRMVLASDPHNAPAWCHLGHYYYARGNWETAEQAYRKAVEIEPSNIAFTHLMFEYFRRREFEKAEELGLHILSTQPDNLRMIGALATCYQLWGKHDLANKYYDKIAFLENRAYNAQTIDNYRQIKKILDERGIPLVCVQYPMRSVEPLKKIFNDQQGPIFVDNEIAFKKAIRGGRYTYYFTDNFGGDFGHCTRAGNRLLAENIADTILKDYF